jgi:hypothetical protein
VTGWPDYLGHVEDVLDRAEGCLRSGDVDGAVEALSALVGRGPDEGLPPLPADAVERAEGTARRLAAGHAAVLEVLGRMAPELVALGRLSPPAAAGPLFLDQTA